MENLYLTLEIENKDEFITLLKETADNLDKLSNFKLKINRRLEYGEE